MSVLYFDPQRRLQAYDDIRVGGTGEAQVNLERHVIREPEPDPSVTPPPGTAPPASPAPPRAPAPTR
jgi:hypothetical protein